MQPSGADRHAQLPELPSYPEVFETTPRRSLSGVLITIRKLRNGQYRLYSCKTDPKTGKRKNLGTFSSRAAAEKHERDVQYLKRH
jgi:hypothetical protein